MIKQREYELIKVAVNDKYFNNMLENFATYVEMIDYTFEKFESAMNQISSLDLDLKINEIQNQLIKKYGISNYDNEESENLSSYICFDNIEQKTTENKNSFKPLDFSTIDNMKKEYLGKINELIEY